MAVARAAELYRAGRFGEAVEEQRRVLAADPGGTEAFLRLAEALLHEGRFAAAEVAAGAVLAAADFAANGGLAVAHAVRGAALEARGQGGDALAAYREAIRLQPRLLAAHVGCGRVLQLEGKSEAAVEAFRAAVALAPEEAELRAVLGIALTTCGRSAEAMAAFDAALARDPDCVTAHVNASGLRTFAADSPDIARMERLIEDPGRSEADRLRLRFALAKAWTDAGDSERAFAHLAEGNRMKRATFEYDIAAAVRHMEEIAAAFTPATMARLAGGGSDSALPVFVVGMPRSGSTLVEQILASHPQIAAAGEIAALKEILRRLRRGGEAVRFPDVVADMAKADFGTIAALYLRLVAPMAEGRARLVDKMLDNFLLAGLIHLCFPNARIVHCRRDPVDTCFSCYSLLFGPHQPFAYELGELGRYWRAYDALMAHWRTVLPPDRLIEVRYEKVVDDLDGEARRLVAFCGLPWDDACLDFHKTQRVVTSASALQVRQPIFRSGLGRWRPFARHLGPLLEALGEGAEDR